MDRVLALYRLSARQHGAVSIPQLRGLGLTYDQIDHLIESGHWLRLTPMVLVRTGTPDTDAAACMAAVLDAGLGAALSHWSNAAWWGIPGFRLRPIHVTRTRKRSDTPARLAVIHEPRHFPAAHRRILRGVPVTVPSRIPFDLAATDPWGAERALDRCWARGLLSHASCMAMLDELAERGRKGITHMRELLDARGPDYRPNDSGVEDRFQELCREVGLEVDRQRDLLGRGEWLGRVDFLVRGRPVVLEVDSALYHEALIDRRADAARTAALQAEGYEIHRFTDHEIFHDRHGTLRRLRSIRSGR